MAATVECPECKYQTRVAEDKLCLGIRCPKCHDAFMNTLAVDKPVETGGFGRPRRKGPATRLSRLGAAIIDGVLFGAGVGPTMIGLSTSGSIGVFLFLFGLLTMLVLAVLNFVWLSTKGQTIGKRLVGIRIVNYFDGRNPGFMGAVVMRNVVPAFLGIIPLFGLVDILYIFTEERRCVHDLIAGTRVIEV